MGRAETFRIAVRKYGPFENAIAKQWASFEAKAQTGLALEAVAMDLHPLEEALFANNGMANGDWDVGFVATDWIAAMHKPTLQWILHRCFARPAGGLSRMDRLAAPPTAHQAKLCSAPHITMDRNALSTARTSLTTPHDRAPISGSSTSR